MSARDEPASNIRLVQEIEKYPCLYNYTLPEYSKKEVTDKAWHKVTTEMKDTVFNCKERWRNIRTVFVRKMKLAAGGSGRKYTKTYYMMDAMQFLLPYVRVHQPIDTFGNLPSPGQEASEEVKEDSDREPEDEHSEAGVPQECAALPSTHNIAARAESRRQKKKRSSVSDMEQTFKDFVNMKKARMNMDDDSRKQFLLSLLPDVHAMTDTQMRKFRQLVLHAVDTVLDEPFNGTHTGPSRTVNRPSPHAPPPSNTP